MEKSHRLKINYWVIRYGFIIKSISFRSKRVKVRFSNSSILKSLNILLLINICHIKIFLTTQIYVIRENDWFFKFRLYKLSLHKAYLLLMKIQICVWMLMRSHGNSRLNLISQRAANRVLVWKHHNHSRGVASTQVFLLLVKAVFQSASGRIVLRWVSMQASFRLNSLVSTSQVSRWF